MRNKSGCAFSLYYVFVCFLSHGAGFTPKDRIQVWWAEAFPLPCCYFWPQWAQVLNFFAHFPLSYTYIIHALFFRRVSDWGHPKPSRSPWVVWGSQCVTVDVIPTIFQVTAQLSMPETHQAPPGVTVWALTSTSTLKSVRPEANYLNYINNTILSLHT